MEAPTGELRVASSEGAADASRGVPASAEPSASRLMGRPDLAQDSLSDLRIRSGQLKQEAAQVKRELKNKKRQKQRILRRVSRLATADIVQALLDRGVQLQEAATAAAARADEGTSAAASSASPPAAPLADASVTRREALALDGEAAELAMAMAPVVHDPMEH